MTNDTVHALVRAFIAQFFLIFLIVSFYIAMSFSLGKELFNGQRTSLKNRLVNFKKVLTIQKMRPSDLIEIVISLGIITLGVTFLPLTDSFVFRGSLFNTDIISSDYSLWFFISFSLALMFYILGLEEKDKDAHALIVFFFICLSFLIPICFGTSSLRYVVYSQVGDLRYLGLIKYPIMALCYFVIMIILSKRLSLKLRDFNLKQNEQKTSYMDSLLNLALLFYVNLLFVYLFLGGYNSFLNFSFIVDYLPISLVLIQALSLSIKFSIVCALTAFAQKIIPYSNPKLQAKLLRLVIIIMVTSTLLISLTQRFIREGGNLWPV